MRVGNIAQSARYPKFAAGLCSESCTAPGRDLDRPDACCGVTVEIEITGTARDDVAMHTESLVDCSAPQKSHCSIVGGHLDPHIRPDGGDC